MRWEADVRIAGTVASMGQRVIQPIVTQQVSNVLAALEREVQMEKSGELKDAGPPAESTPEAEPAAAEGSSAAEEGISPLHPETYTAEPEGPTTSTED
jgi:hypothetical protein